VFSWVVATTGAIFISALILTLTILLGFLPSSILRPFSIAVMLVSIFLSAVGLGALWWIHLHSPGTGSPLPF